MAHTSDYIEHPDHDFSHLSYDDVKFLHERGAVVAEFYAKSSRHAEGRLEIVRLYKYTTLFGETFYEAVQDNRIVIEKSAIAQAA